MIALIIGVLVVTVVGVALLTPIQDTVDNYSGTATNETLVGLIPLLVIVALLLSIVMGAIVQKYGS